MILKTSVGRTVGAAIRQLLKLRKPFPNDLLLQGSQQKERKEAAHNIVLYYRHNRNRRMIPNLCCHVPLATLTDEDNMQRCR
jgi:hypothetical protein